MIASLNNHTSQIVCQPITSYGAKWDGKHQAAQDWELQTVAMQSLTSPFCRMGPSDIHFIVSLTKHLDDKKFVTDANVKQAVPSCLQNMLHWFLMHLDTSPGGQMLKYQWLTTWRFDMCHVCIQVRMKFRASRVLVTLLFETSLYIIINFKLYCLLMCIMEN
jgi:hypothetical protein